MLSADFKRTPVMCQRKLQIRVMKSVNACDHGSETWSKDFKSTWLSQTAFICLGRVLEGFSASEGRERPLSSDMRAKQKSHNSWF